MAKRDFDFSPVRIFSILAYYGNVCAACGADDSLNADHWIAGESTDEGVCLCSHCNSKVKRNMYIPETFRLIPRAPLNVVTHAEYKIQVAANREAFAEWVYTFRYARKQHLVKKGYMKYFQPKF